jgi:hypothetical protein
MKTILDTPTGLRHGSVAVAEDFIKRMKLEIKDAKKRGQRKIWVYWHFNSRNMMFMDHDIEFQAQAKTYKMQGFALNRELSDSHDISLSAELVGAKSAARHIFINPSLVIGEPKSGDRSYDPVAMFLGDRLTAFNEFITLEFTTY